MYSSKLTFFLEHQITVVSLENETKYKFFSRLNGDLFIPIKYFNDKPEPRILLNICISIHDDLILKGECI